MRPQHPTSILLLDDNHDVVDLYRRQIEKEKGHRVTTQTDGYSARLVAAKQLFDAVVIDAKLNYRSVEFGGLRLADELAPRYGANSILVISRFITADLMRERGEDFAFMEKYGPDRGGMFGTDLCKAIGRMRLQQFVFVAMPFAPEHAKLYRTQIKPAIHAAGFKCIRVDEVPHTKLIDEVIFDLVKKCKLVIFVADGGNPNAYYEAGFADAMRKEVIIVAQSLSDLRFDVSHRNTIIYGGDPSSLRLELTKRIANLRLFPPVTL